MRNNNRQNIPNHLRKLRKQRGLKQNEVAQILGLKSTSMISRWEAGLCLPETQNLFRLAIIYRTSSEGLFHIFTRRLQAKLAEKEEKIFRNRIHGEHQC